MNPTPSIDEPLDHEEALLLAHHRSANSNLARCYIELTTRLENARRDAIEEAAKVADEWGVSILQFPAENLQEHVEAMMNEIGPNIAAAIRSLATGEGET